MYYTCNISIRQSFDDFQSMLRQSQYKEGKSAASFCHQAIAWFPDMFSNFYLVKNHKIVKKNSTTTKAREKISTDLEFLEF